MICAAEALYVDKQIVSFPYVQPGRGVPGSTHHGEKEAGRLPIAPLDLRFLIRTVSRSFALGGPNRRDLTRLVKARAQS